MAAICSDELYPVLSIAPGFDQPDALLKRSEGRLRLLGATRPGRGRRGRGRATLVCRVVGLMSTLVALRIEAISGHRRGRRPCWSIHGAGLHVAGPENLEAGRWPSARTAIAALQITRQPGFALVAREHGAHHGGAELRSAMTRPPARGLIEQPQAVGLHAAAASTTSTLRRQSAGREAAPQPPTPGSPTRYEPWPP